jgi:hypothetical protein
MIAAAEDTAFVMKALREGVLSETMDIEKAVAWLQKAAAKAPVATRKDFILSFADVFVLQERLVREDTGIMTTMEIGFCVRLMKPNVFLGIPLESLAPPQPAWLQLRVRSGSTTRGGYD